MLRSWPPAGAEVFPDEDFADLSPSGRGRPSIPATVMAAVLTWQTLDVGMPPGRVMTGEAGGGCHGKRVCSSTIRRVA